MADVFLNCANGRKKSPAYEIRWLNLCGFCLRPGFGYPGDDFRIEQVRRVYAGGITYGNQVQCEIDWWIFWGRVAGGLNRNQQADVYQRVSASLMPRGSKKPQRVNAVVAARNVADGGESGIAAAGHEGGVRRCAGKAHQGGRLQRERILVPLPIGRAQAVLWPHQSCGRRAGHCYTLGGGRCSITRMPATHWRRSGAAPKTRCAIYRSPHATPSRASCKPWSHADRLIAVLEGEEQDDATLGRIFGEELPSGLVLAEQT